MFVACLSVLIVMYLDIHQHAELASGLHLPRTALTPPGVVALSDGGDLYRIRI